MAIPSFVAVAEDRNTGSAITLPVPAGAAGELLVAVLGVKINPSTSTPAGWTPIIAGFNGCVSASDPSIGIRAQLSAWWKVSDGTETSVSFTLDTAGNISQASGGVLRYSGADTTDPIDVFACGNGTSAAPTAPSVTTTSNDDRVLRLVVSDADDAKSLFTTEPATKRFEIESSVPFGPGASVTSEAVVTAASDEGQATAGPTGTAAWALPSSDQWAAMTVAIKPASTGGNGGTEPSGCLGAILALIKRILEAIANAIKKLVEALTGWWRRRKGTGGK